MYCLAYKHIELFKQIPFSDFSAKGNFIQNVVNDPGKYGTFENILKCYYFISDEIWDYNIVKPLLQYNNKTAFYHFYDFIQKRIQSLNSKRYKTTKMMHAVLDKNGNNRNFKKQHGLIVQIKKNKKKPELVKLKENFLEYSYGYNQDLKYYKKHKIELPEQWLEYLYMTLRELSEKANFFYKHRGSTILAQEMVNILSNQSIFVYSGNLIRYGHNRKKIIRQIKEQKQFMFGEIKHDTEHYKEIKARQQTNIVKNNLKQY